MICQIEGCGKFIEDNPRSISNHIRIHEISPKDYYDKYMKKEGEGICKNIKEKCINKHKKETYFRSIGDGYKDYCCKECASMCVQHRPEVRQKHKATLKERYGNENYVNTEAAAKTRLENMGYKYFPNPKDIRKLTLEEERSRTEKIKATKLERYGDENYCNAEQISKTKLKNNEK